MLKKWIAENAPWLTFIAMSMLGGIIAHIRFWERAQHKIEPRDHIKGLLVRSLYAGMAGLIVYLCAQAAIEAGWKVSEPLTYVFAGIGGMFGSELFDFIFTTGKDWIRKRLGLERKP